MMSRWNSQRSSSTKFCPKAASKGETIFAFEREPIRENTFIFFRIRIMAGVRSEDELGIKWDRCLADTGVKLLGGAVFLTTLIDIDCILLFEPS